MGNNLFWHRWLFFLRASPPTNVLLFHDPRDPPSPPQPISYVSSPWPLIRLLLELRCQMWKCFCNSSSQKPWSSMWSTALGGGCGGGEKNLGCFTVITFKFGSSFYYNSIGSRTHLPYLSLLWKGCLGSPGDLPEDCWAKFVREWDISTLTQIMTRHVQQLWVVGPIKLDDIKQKSIWKILLRKHQPSFIVRKTCF